MSGITRRPFGLVVLSAVIVVATGCPKPEKGGTTPKGHPTKGPHEGTLIEFGEEEYHGEFTVDHDKKEAVVYILDSSAAKAADLPAGKIKRVNLKITNSEPPIDLDLTHDPKRSDAKGIAFAGLNIAFAKVMDFKGKVTMEIDGKPPYVGDFAEKDHPH